MSRFMPSQGPGIGFRTIRVCNTCTNDIIPRGEGTLTVLGKSTVSPPYSILIATLPANAPGKLVGVLQNAVAVGEKVDICVHGRTKVLSVSGFSINDYLTTTLLGDMDVALSGETVYARALETVGANQMGLVDFDGDAGFGVLP